MNNIVRNVSKVMSDERTYEMPTIERKTKAKTNDGFATKPTDDDGNSV
jgi:hypothetical protein